MLDWAHAAQEWINDYQPMDNGAGLAKQCSVIKERNPHIKCNVYVGACVCMYVSVCACVCRYACVRRYVRALHHVRLGTATP